MLTFNGHGWRLDKYTDQSVIKFYDEKEKVTNMINSKIMFSYVCLNDDDLENDLHTIKELIRIDNSKLLIGIENLYTDSKKYYNAIKNIGSGKVTFLGLFDGFAFGNCVKVKGYGDIPNSLGKNNVYLIDAGKETIRIITELRIREKENTYIDIRYNKKLNNEIINNEKMNWWMFALNDIKSDISVVLTLYKKPEALRKQINAIKCQTISISNLYLLQDGIEEDYSITLKENLLDEFDDVRICNENRGVWERFEFAKAAVKTKYVCVFDDDTIPGDRWLENCHIHMQFDKGIYGTNGILLMDDYLEYPYGGCIDVGWHMPNKRKVQVDFVGHSWFMDKNCLDYMFEAKEVRGKYKYVGEDISLSVQAKKYEIPTFVPPHPIAHGDLWGSIPEEGTFFGCSAAAISLNRQRLDEMREVIGLLHEQGWEPIIKNDYNEVKKIQKELIVNNEESQIVDEMNDFFCEGNVFIYGAGKFAGIIADFADYKGWKYVGFVVTNNNGILNYKNKTVFQIDEIKQWQDLNIILGLSSQYHEEVCEILSDLNCKSIFPPSVAPFSYDKFVEGLIHHD